ncbi:aminotransferase class I/II-fold pyridoxal phosphate-dependent enzyme [Nocardioides bruguierae]|uniref:aminotransferase class I/II-fold pyridoxal phosphate-dependent enzyme n=1 Tax=Nocardioides bruguierae TaxID=2945102 RepID=UPI0020200892|nr:aminotransferase class I/II-fold pyridoxal phosphate-dependent enzyme [Nocardioides bruguierae]MCL8023956.1 aminotransferase class I/II-fold pyridoxal phosphate-dependent enzyme [Nocardioides bruguierae]
MQGSSGRPPTAARLASIAPTVFSSYSALAVATGSVNLGQGFPDVDGPAEVVEAARAALAAGHNQYAPGPGTPGLRAAIAEHQRERYGITLDPATEVVVTTGATEAVAAAVLGLVEPGDEVLVLEPWYDSYVAMLQVAGAVRVPVTLRAPDFRLDVAALRAAVTDRTRAILLNTPHNPTGTVLTDAELEAVAALAVEHDLLVITDEVYEHLTLDGRVHRPPATFPGMAERTLSISSLGKSFSLTGWKIGWATGPAHLVGALLAAKQWLTFTSGAPLQPAAEVALREHAHWPGELARDLQGRRDLLVSGLVQAGVVAPGAAPPRPEGTYFAVTDVAHLGWADGEAFCRALPERAGVVAIPLQGFGDSDAGTHLVRWTFCKRPEVLTQAVERLLAADLHA